MSRRERRAQQNGANLRAAVARLRAELAAPHAPVLIYDGGCPLCAAYSRAVRLRRDFGALVLVNARERPDLAQMLTSAGIDLDEGFVCIAGDELYHAARAIHAVACMSSGSTVVSRVNQLILSNRRLARLCYPALAAGRGLLLRLLGRGRIVTEL